MPPRTPPAPRRPARRAGSAAPRPRARAGSHKRSPACHWRAGSRGSRWPSGPACRRRTNPPPPPRRRSPGCPAGCGWRRAAARAAARPGDVDRIAVQRGVVALLQRAQPGGGGRVRRRRLEAGHARAVGHQRAGAAGRGEDGDALAAQRLRPVASAAGTSSRSEKVCARITPTWRNSASYMRSAPASAPVCGTAARAPLSGSRS